MQNRKNLRRVSVLMNAQTLYHLERIAADNGYGDKIGKVIDDMVRKKQAAERKKTQSFRIEGGNRL